MTTGCLPCVEVPLRWVRYVTWTHHNNSTRNCSLIIIPKSDLAIWLLFETKISNCIQLISSQENGSNCVNNNNKTKVSVYNSSAWRQKYLCITYQSQKDLTVCVNDWYLNHYTSQYINFQQNRFLRMSYKFTNFESLTSKVQHQTSKITAFCVYAPGMDRCCHPDLLFRGSRIRGPYIVCQL